MLVKTPTNATFVQKVSGSKLNFENITEYITMHLTWDCGTLRHPILSLQYLTWKCL